MRGNDTTSTRAIFDYRNTEFSASVRRKTLYRCIVAFFLRLYRVEFFNVLRRVLCLCVCFVVHMMDSRVCISIFFVFLHSATHSGEKIILTGTLQKRV